MDQRKRASRNLVIFWLVLLGIPVLLLSSCFVFGLRPCCTDISLPTPTP